MAGSTTFEAFIDRLTQGHYFPGQRLTEQSIIDEYNISRGNARILLQNLQAAGIVEIHKHKGASIRRYSDTEVRDIFLIRQRLEGLAARLAAENLNPSEHVQEYKLFQSVANGTLESDQFRQSNKIFHDTILALSNSPSLKRVIENMVIPMQHIQIRAFVNESYEQSSRQEHKKIATALLENNADEADRYMQEHIQNAMQRIQSLRIVPR